MNLASQYVQGGEAQAHLETMPETEARMALLQMAMAMTGAEGTDYQNIVGPYESKQMRKDMLHVWGCGLVGRAFLRLAGIYSRRFAPPYRSTKAFEDIYETALEYGVLTHQPVIPTALGTLIAMGRGNAAHMAILLAVYEGFAWTIDGGQQAQDGKQTILYRRRKVQLRQKTSRVLRTTTTAEGIFSMQNVDFKTDEPNAPPREVIWSVDPLDLAHRAGTAWGWRMPNRTTPPLPPPPGFHFSA